MPKDPTVDVAYSASRIIDTLKKQPDSSAAEIAERVGLGRSTATKKLADLEKAGLAVRVPGTREGSIRTPDLWSLASAPGPRASSEHRSSKGGTAPEAKGAASRTKARPGGSDRKTKDSADRLPRGELAKLVREYLDTHPGAHSPTAIASDLQRSAGAVANALVRLVDEAEALLIQVAPKRYQAVEERKG